MEIETGRFDRKIFFPDLNIDKDNPKITYINGILRIAFNLGTHCGKDYSRAITTNFPLPSLFVTGCILVTQLPLILNP